MSNFTFRVIYQKSDNLRFTSILNLQKIVWRLFRRSHIQLVYSNGFHPQPMMKFFCPLPLGFIGLNEVLDVTILNWIEPHQLLQDINKHSLPGLSFKKASFLEKSNKQGNFIPFAAEYIVNSKTELLRNEEIEKNVEVFLEKTSFFKERRGKSYDLRTLVHLIDIEIPIVRLILSAKTNATGRPDEVMEALGYDPMSFTYSRINFINEEMNHIP